MPFDDDHPVFQLTDEEIERRDRRLAEKQEERRRLEAIDIPSVTVADVDSEAIEWLWDDRLPIGKLIVLDGEPGVAKSAVMVDLAARLTTGNDFPEELRLDQRAPADVVTLGAEDAISDTIRPRLEAAGADLNRVHVACTVPTGTHADDGTPLNRLIQLPNDVPKIERLVRSHAARLLIVDVMAAFIHPDLRTNSDQDMRGALAPLAAMAERTRCCVVLIRHLNKRSGESALMRGGGSIGIIGAGRLGLTAGWHPGDRNVKDVNARRRVLAVTKVNITRYAPTLAYKTREAVLPGGISTVAIDWLGTTAYTADDVVQAGGVRQTDRDDIDEWLRNLLKPGPITAKEVFRLGKEHEDYSEKRLRSAKKRIGAEHRVHGYQGPIVWFFADPPGDDEHIRGVGDEQ